MATKTSLIINAVNEGKTLQKAIADVNPQATTAELKAFAQGMLGLTDYTYTNGALVERTDLDDETSITEVTFWLGDEQLTLTQSGVNPTTRLCDFRLSELATNENVTHDEENHQYKFTIEVRGAYDANARTFSPKQKCVFAMQTYTNILRGFNLHFDGDPPNRRLVIDCIVPDTHSAPFSNPGAIGNLHVLSTVAAGYYSIQFQYNN